MGGGKKRKKFFSEEKNQKTFASWHVWWNSTDARKIKVFCFFFSKKKGLPFA